MIVNDYQRDLISFAHRMISLLIKCSSGGKPDENTGIVTLDVVQRPAGVCKPGRHSTAVSVTEEATSITFTLHRLRYLASAFRPPWQ